MVRIRFAPSPTGFLHIGGSRTALFNWLFAKNQNGKFILRIEDTDQKRSRQEYLQEILDSLKWLGMDWDEVYYQSKRFPLYKESAQKLLEQSQAYIDKGAIIYKVKPRQVEINDFVHGKIQFDSSLIKDQVLIKSDGTPTYNFACVVDDADMEISHVIRGDDHISNTPKQIILYEALGLPLPAFAHIPLILNKEGGRLSKRTGATAVSDYRKQGFLPEAVVNYLLLLGWSPGTNQEIVSKEEAIKKFSLANINKTAASFDIDKFKWINSQYIRQADSERLADLLIPILLKKKYIQPDFDRAWLVHAVKLFQGRINTLLDFMDWADFLFVKKIVLSSEAKEIILKKDLSKEFSLLEERFNNLASFDTKTVEEAFRGLVNELDIKAGELIHPLRAALTGKTIGPGIFDVVTLLGKEKVLSRIGRLIKTMKKQ